MRQICAQYLVLRSQLHVICSHFDFIRNQPITICSQLLVMHSELSFILNLFLVRRYQPHVIQCQLGVMHCQLQVIRNPHVVRCQLHIWRCELPHFTQSTSVFPNPMQHAINNVFNKRSLALFRATSKNVLFRHPLQESSISDVIIDLLLLNFAQEESNFIYIICMIINISITCYKRPIIHGNIIHGTLETCCQRTLEHKLSYSELLYQLSADIPMYNMLSNVQPGYIYICIYIYDSNQILWYYWHHLSYFGTSLHLLIKFLSEWKPKIYIPIATK